MDIQTMIEKWQPATGSPMAATAAQYEKLETEADRLTVILDRRVAELKAIDERAAVGSFDADLRELAIDRIVRPATVEQIEALRQAIFRANDNAQGLLRRLRDMNEELTALEAKRNAFFEDTKYRLLTVQPAGRSYGRR